MPRAELALHKFQRRSVSRGDQIVHCPEGSKSETPGRGNDEADHMGGPMDRV